jgi:hypothetical protein
MALHIDEISTDVQMQDEPAGAAAPAAAEPLWQQLARLRQLQQQLLCDDTRTSACGNED